jgi:hypothetical protein
MQGLETSSVRHALSRKVTCVQYLRHCDSGAYRVLKRVSLSASLSDRGAHTKTSLRFVSIRKQRWWSCPCSCVRKHYAMKVYGGSGYIHLGASWRWEVSFTPQSLYPRGKSPQYPLDSRMCGLQSQSVRHEEGKFMTLPRFEPVASRCTDWAIPAVGNYVQHFH